MFVMEEIIFMIFRIFIPATRNVSKNSFLIKRTVKFDLMNFAYK